MPMTEFLAEALLGQIFRGASYSFPTTLYCGLGVAPVWTASTAYAVGAYVVGSAFNSTNRHIYKATAVSGSGTSGSSEPSWNQGAGATTVDNSGANQITWTECTNLFDASTVTALEISGSGYTREGVVCSTGDWSITAGPPAQVANINAIAFPSPTATWGNVVVAFLSDASTAGNLLAWTLLTSEVVAGSGSSPSYAASALTYSLT